MSLEQTIQRINEENNNKRAEAKERRKQREDMLALLETHRKDETSLLATISKTVKGGYILSIENLPDVRAFLPGSMGTHHGVVAPVLSPSFKVIITEVNGPKAIVVSAVEWLEEEIRIRKLAWAQNHRYQTFTGRVVHCYPPRAIYDVGGSFIVQIGETEDGISVAGRLNENHVMPLLSLHVGDYVEVAIASIDWGIVLRPSPALAKQVAAEKEKREAEMEKKATQYPRGYKPPRRPEAKDAPNPIPTMGAGLLRQYFVDLLEYNQRMPEDIVVSLKKRDDWRTKDLLRGNADWCSAYKKVVARDKARRSSAEDLSDLAREGMTVGEFKEAVKN